MQNLIPKPNLLSQMRLNPKAGLNENQAQQLGSELSKIKASRIKIASHTLLRSKKYPSEWYIFKEENTKQNMIGSGACGKVYPAQFKIVIPEKGNAEIHPVSTRFTNNDNKPIKQQKAEQEQQLSEYELKLEQDEQEQKLYEKDQQRHNEHQEKLNKWHAERSYVVKSQPLQDNKTKLNQEAHFQSEQYVEVRDVIHVPSEAGKSYTIMEHCGMPLDEYLPKLAESEEGASFDFRLQKIVLAIINEMLTLQRQDILHRDLKLENICIRETGTGENYAIQVFFIDFGFSLKKDDPRNKTTIAGTPNYVAPELPAQGSSAASEIYALAGILYQVFGADPFENKTALPFPSRIYNKQIGSAKLQAIFNAPFSDDDLFDNLDMSGVDQQLQQDIKNFLNLMQDPEPTKRPTLEWIYKFFASIPERQEAITNMAEYKDKKEELSRAFEDFSKKNHEVRQQQPEKTAILPHLPEQKELLEIVKPLLTYKKPSHYKVTQTMVAKNLPLSDYSDILLAEITDAIKKTKTLTKDLALIKKRLEICATTAQEILDVFNPQKANEKINGTNSSGIKQLQKIATNKQPLWEKLKAMQKVAAQKLKPGFSLWFSQSKLFSRKGRTDGTQKLFERLAELDVDAIAQLEKTVTRDLISAQERKAVNAKLRGVNNVLIETQRHIEHQGTKFAHTKVQ